MLPVFEPRINDTKLKLDTIGV